MRYSYSHIKSKYIGNSTIQRFFKLASWTLLSVFFEKFAMIIIVFLLAQILGAQDYGRLTLVQGLVNSLQILVVLGAGSVLSRYIPKMREESLHRAVEIINLCAILVMGTVLVFTLVALTGGHSLIIETLAMPVSSAVPEWIVMWVVLTAINSLLLTVMLSFEKGRILGLVSLLSAGLSIVLVPSAAKIFGVQGAITGLVIVELVKMTAFFLIYALFLYSEGVPLLTPIRRSDLPIFVRFGLPMFLQTVLWSPIIWIAQLIIKTQAQDGLTSVGIFGFTNNVLGSIIILSALTNRAALPILSSLEAKGRFSELRRVSFFMTAGQTGAATVIALGVILGSRFIMAHAGESFQDSWLVLVIMAIAGIVISAQTSIGNYLIVMGCQYFLLLTMIPWTIILIGSVVFFPTHGAYALAGGLLAATTLRTSLFFWRAFIQRSPTIARDAVAP